MNKFENPDPFILTPNKGQFVKVVFGFLDILGFSNAVLETDNPSQILSLLSFLDPKINQPYDIPIQRRMISDSILLWSEGEESLFPILDLMGSIQHSLYTKGFLSRGVVLLDDHLEVRQIKLDSNGKEYHGDYLFISKALIKAYQLEKKLGDRPFIKMSEVPESVILRNNKKWSSTQSLFDEYKEVNCYYKSHQLDALNFNSQPSALLELNQKQLAEACFENGIETLTLFKKQIIDNLEIGRSTKDLKITAKWNVMKGLHNAFTFQCLSKWEDESKIEVLNRQIIK